MAIIRGIWARNWKDGREISLEEHAADLRAEGARVELFDAPRKIYGGASSADIEAVGRYYTYEGAVFDTRERNYHDDSDFYALVWDEAKGRIITVDYDSTRGGGGGNATIDATEEVQAKANAYLERWAHERLIEDDRARAQTVEKGRRVRVKKGRTAPIGTEGVVFWIGAPRKFNHYSPATIRIGIATSERKENGKYADVVWSYAHNVEVLDHEQYLTADSVLAERAKRVHGNWNAVNGYYSARAGLLVA